MSGGVNFSGPARIENSAVVGRDYNDNRRRNIRIGVGGLVLLVLLLGGFLVYHTVSASQDVVFETGLRGATDTAARIRQAEIDQDADRWCYLASSTSGGPCRALMANSFSSANPRRSEAAQVQVGTATGTSGAAAVPVRYGGRTIGQLPMVWSGTRWELNTSMYPLAISDGGILMAAVEAEHGCGAIFGISTGC